MNNYDEYDQESQALLHGIKSLNFEEVMGSKTTNPFQINHLNSISDYTSTFAKKFEFKSLNSKEIADNYFNGIKPIKQENTIVYQEPETKVDVTFKEMRVYRDNDTTKGFQEEGDKLLYKIIAYISTSQSKLESLYLKSENQVGDKEILLFLEDNTNDFSEQYLFARFGKSVNKEHLLSAQQQNNLLELVPDFSSDMLKELILNGKVKAKTTATSIIAKGLMYIVSIIGLPAKAIGWVCNEIGEAIRKYLSIPESIWDSKGKDYFLKKENVLKDLQINTSFTNIVSNSLKNQDQFNWLNSFLSIQNATLFIAKPINAIEKLVNNYNLEVQKTLDLFYEENSSLSSSSLVLSEQIAFLCGLWNGLVDFIAGIFTFLGMILSVQYDIATNINDIMETIDELYDNIKKIKFTDVLISAVTTYFQILNEINKFFTSKDPRENYNLDKIAYFVGFGLAFIATLFIPVADITKISSITKISKLIPEEFITSLSQVKGKAINGIKPLLALAREMSEVLTKGAEEITAFLQRIKKAIVEWFKKNKKTFEKKSKVREYLSVIRRYNFRTTKILKRYIGEQTGNGWCAPSIVQYLDEIGRAKFELAIVDGKFYSANGKLFDTTISKTVFSNGKAIFVMSKDGRVFASTLHVPKKFHHSSFLAGEAVASAGEIKVINGVITEVTRKSGHYQPTEKINRQFIKMLQKEKIDIKNIIIKDGF